MGPLKEKLLKYALEILEKAIPDDIQQVADEWIVARLKDLAAKTDNEIDDKLVALVAKALGVKA